MMMAYNDGFDDINMNIPDSFNRRKLQLPLLFPKPYLKNTSTTQHSCFPHYHPLEHVSYRDTAIAEQKKLMKTAQPQVVVSSRWNPAPEQLRSLEELYRRGTRTPSAEQIQNITAQLKRYGKIEGKNVFYWFQNHKARERQKRRRQIMESTPQDQNLMSERKELSGTTRKILDEGQEQQITESFWEYNDVSTQRVAKARAESNTTDGLIQFDELRDQLQINRRNSSFMARNSTWQMIQLYCPPLPPVNNNNNNNNNNNPSTTTTTTRSASTVRRTLMDQNQLIKKFHDLKNLYNITPFSTETGFNYHHQDHDNQAHEDFYNIGGESDDQTLELFPHGSCGSGTLNGKDSNGTGAPQQFFEFLPLKN